MMEDEEIYTFIIKVNKEQLIKMHDLLDDDFENMKEIIQIKIDDL